MQWGHHRDEGCLGTNGAAALHQPCTSPSCSTAPALNLPPTTSWLAAGVDSSTASSPIAGGGPKRKSHGRYKEEIERLRGRISCMKMEAIGDYEYMMMQVTACLGGG